MNWGPIDPDWGEGWEDFEHDPFADQPAAAHRRRGTVTRMPRPRRGRRGTRLDQSLTAPRPASRRRAHEPTAPRETAGHVRVSDGRHLSAVPTLPTIDMRRSGQPARVARPRSGRAPRDASSSAAPPRHRTRMLSVILVLLLLAVVAKLVHVQVIEPDRFVSLGEEQRLRTVALEANRGRILDRNGHELAMSVLRPSVFADPSQIEDPRRAAAALAPVLGIEESELSEKFERDTQFVYLSRWIDDDLAGQVVGLDLDGIHLLEEPERFAPSGDLARAIIGKVASDETGAIGIELLYDDVLTGTPGEVSYERAPNGDTIAAGGETRIAPTAGNDVVLTLDRSLQYEAERVLAEQVDAMGADGGMVVISEPATGALLALANITRNTDGKIIKAGANRAVIDVFEPGSVNKVITVAAALEEGIVSPSTRFEVPWQYQVSDHLFTDHDPHPTEMMTVTDILTQSSNIGTIKIGQELGKERIDEYLRAFGFGAPTALGFPNESRGLLLDPERWSGTSIGSIPIGQGIAVTALQMLNAYNVIANDGVYVEPRLVDATIDADATRHEVPPVTTGRVVSERTARQMRSMLSNVVEQGTGTRAHVPGYTVAGKTGTARKPQDTGTYRDEAGNYHYVAAFTGMVPAEDPAISMIVVIDEPTATIYGGTAAAPVFSNLAAFALNRFRIPPANP